MGRLGLRTYSSRAPEDTVGIKLRQAHPHCFWREPRLARRAPRGDSLIFERPGEYKVRRQNKTILHCFRSNRADGEVALSLEKLAYPTFRIILNRWFRSER